MPCGKRTSRERPGASVGGRPAQPFTRSASASMLASEPLQLCVTIGSFAIRDLAIVPPHPARFARFGYVRGSRTLSKMVRCWVHDGFRWLSFCSLRRAAAPLRAPRAVLPEMAARRRDLVQAAAELQADAEAGPRRAAAAHRCMPTRH